MIERADRAGATGLVAECRGIRLELNEPGVHPYMSLSLRGVGTQWIPSAILGARQVRYSHLGSSLPRLFTRGEEQESGEHLQRLPGEDGRSVVIRDVRGGFEIESSVSIREDVPLVNVVHTLTPTAAVGLNRIFDRFDFLSALTGDPGGNPDYSFVPHLRPREDMIISDHVFRSPVVMMRKGDVFFALLPDLELMEECYRTTPARYYFDYLVDGGENRCPAVCFGIGHSKPTGHVYFEEEFDREFQLKAGQKVTLAYDLVLDRSGFGPDDVLALLWDRYGRRALREHSPQATGFDRYAAAAFNRMFKRDDIFRHFELEGQPCGGTVGIHLMTRRGVRLMTRRQLNRYLRSQDLSIGFVRFYDEHLMSRQWGAALGEKFLYRYGPSMPPQVFFQSWFNNLRSAYGAYWFSRKWRDGVLKERALEVKNLAILAPGEAGAFPAVCYPTDEGVFWSRGTRAFKHIDEYHTADLATTGYYMMMWFRDHERDPRLLRRGRELARFLVKVQLPSGAFPAWVKPGDPPGISSILRESATTAAPAMFLALLYTIDEDDRNLESALKAAEFIAERVMPEQKWFDYETFFSCSHKRAGLYDARTGTYPQNTMSVYWAAELFRLLYVATGKLMYLERGRQVLDHLCLYQQVWDPPFLGINSFGGFGVMNTDGEWNDARQGIIAPVLMDYYRAGGDARHMERGIAALRASFTTMYIEENSRVAPANMEAFKPEERGSVPENYGHFGYDQRTIGYLQSDWGAGSAAFAAAYAQKHYGDVFVDVNGPRAFGINGCSANDVAVEGDRWSLDLKRDVESGLQVEVRFSREPAAGAVVEVNGRPARRDGAGFVADI